MTRTFKLYAVLNSKILLAAKLKLIFLPPTS